MNNADIYALTHLVARGWRDRDRNPPPQTPEATEAWVLMREVIEGMGFIGCDALEAGQWVSSDSDYGQLEAKLKDALLEVDRLKDIIRNDRLPGDTKTMRVEMLTNKTNNGWSLVVTDPIGDEQKTADTIAGIFYLLTETADALARKRLSENPDIHPVSENPDTGLEAQ